jgi:hypothetical protein
LLFFKEAVEPIFLVRVGIGKALKEGGRAFKVKVNSADKGGNRSEGCGSWGQRGTKKRVRYMIGDKKAFNAEINPINGEIRQINAPVL